MGGEREKCSAGGKGRRRRKGKRKMLRHGGVRTAIERERERERERMGVLGKAGEGREGRNEDLSVWGRKQRGNKEGNAQRTR